MHRTIRVFSPDQEGRLTDADEVKVQRLLAGAPPGRWRRVSSDVAPRARTVRGRVLRASGDDQGSDRAGRHPTTVKYSRPWSRKSVLPRDVGSVPLARLVVRSVVLPHQPGHRVEQVWDCPAARPSARRPGRCRAAAAAPRPAARPAACASPGAICCRSLANRERLAGPGARRSRLALADVLPHQFHGDQPCCRGHVHAHDGVPQRWSTSASRRTERAAPWRPRSLPVKSARSARSARSLIATRGSACNGAWPTTSGTGSSVRRRGPCRRSTPHLATAAPPSPSRRPGS